MNCIDPDKSCRLYRSLYQELIQTDFGNRDRDLVLHVVHTAFSHLRLHLDFQNHCEDESTTKTCVDMQASVPFLLQLCSLDFTHNTVRQKKWNNSPFVEKEYKATVKALIKIMIVPTSLHAALRGKQCNSDKDLSDSSQKALSRLKSCMSLTEVLIQIISIDQSLIDSQFDTLVARENQGDHVLQVISMLLAVRWELTQLGRACGFNDADRRLDVYWSLGTGLKAIKFCASGTAGEPKLLMTPPQITQAFDLALKSSSRIQIGEFQAGSDDHLCSMQDIGTLFHGSLKGIFFPKLVLSRSTVDKFSEFAKEIRSIFSMDPVFRYMLLANASPGNEIEEPSHEKPDTVADEIDPEISDLLRVISYEQPRTRLHRNMEHGKLSTREAKRIVPVKLEPTVSTSSFENNSKDVEKIYQHKGRIIMPATFNLDAETREVLWQAYIEDKDRMVEMLGVCFLTLSKRRNIILI